MNERRAIATIVVASAIAMGVGIARTAGAAADDGLCTPPDDDESKWIRVEVQGIAVHVPPAFSEVRRYGDLLWALAGNRGIGIRQGEGPDEMMTGGRFSLLDACETSMGGRPVRVSVLYFTNYDAPLAPSGNRGPRYVGFARWPAMDGMPTVTAWIITAVRSDLRNLRGVFFSAEVGVKAPPPPPPLCVLLRPPPGVDSVLDTAAIARRVQAEATHWPAGFAVLALQFDSTGAIADIAATEGDLPDSTKRVLAELVGTSVRERAAGEVRVRVTSSAAGFRFDVLEALVCPRN